MDKKSIVNCQLSRPKDDQPLAGNVKCKYKAVIFDLGDVYYQNGFKKALALLVIRHTLSEGYLKDVFDKPYVKKIELDKISEKEFWKEFKKDTGLNIDTKKLRKQVFGYFKPNPGMRKLVKDCRKEVKVGLLTNNIKEWFKVQEKKENFEKNFDVVVVSARVGLRKPMKNIYYLTAEKIKVKPKECVFFDDLMDNVDGAKKAGMRAFKFKSAEDARKKLNHLGIF